MNHKSIFSSSCNSRKVLDIGYKGDRNYIHGTDIYNELENMFSDTNNAQFNSLLISTFIKNKCAISMNKQSILSSDRICGNFRYEYNSTSNLGYLLETHYPIENRVSYNEKKITLLTEMSNSKIHQLEHTNYTAIEEIIAMTKHLHYHRLPPKIGKWVFTSININNAQKLDKNGLFSIKISSNLANKLTKSKVFLANLFIATIGFTLTRS